MSNFNIPQELINMVSQNKVIPFIGAGFSSALNLPTWDNMLSQFSKELRDNLEYEKVKEMCNGDPLQIAEYYYLKSGNSIGPLRLAISKILRIEDNPIISGAHVELVNLGAKQIYTTNYDELIEITYRNLSEDVDVIALPKDLALSSGNRTQVIKYHGDLRYENTLVLTESSYYSRLDFESPMDLKFRSDLFGRSVLFIGYSFNDINIRVIWFKLMQVMKDIPQEDRPKSYIIRLDPNPVLEKLYSAVGIKTIILDPTGKHKSASEKNELLANFMFELANMASSNGNIPGTNRKLYLSHSFINHMQSFIYEIKNQTRIRKGAQIDLALNRKIPGELLPNIKNILNELVKISEIYNNNDEKLVELALSIASQIGKNNFVTSIISVGLSRETTRDMILNSGVEWKTLMAGKISKPYIDLIYENFKIEIQGHEEEIFLDEDIAYQVDIMCRIKLGHIADTKAKGIIEEAEKLLERAGAMYSEINVYEPRPLEKPKLIPIIEQIDERERVLEEKG